MTPEQADRIIHLLERIARALEAPPATPQTSGRRARITPPAQGSGPGFDFTGLDLSGLDLDED